MTDIVKSSVGHYGDREVKNEGAEVGGGTTTVHISHLGVSHFICEAAG